MGNIMSLITSKEVKKDESLLAFQFCTKDKLIGLNLSVSVIFKYTDRQK